MFVFHCVEHLLNIRVNAKLSLKQVTLCKKNEKECLILKVVRASVMEAVTTHAAEWRTGLTRMEIISGTRESLFAWLSV